MRIGLISDTHGLLRESAVNYLRGSDLILHAGDVGGPQILETLQGLAPVRAVRGNNDRDAWACGLPLKETFEAAGVRIHLVHDIKDLVFDPAAQGVDVVVTGHSHKPSVDRRDGVLYINPGSAGRRRFKLPISVGRLEVDAGRVEGFLDELDS